MRAKTLGKTGLQVPIVGLGTGSIGLRTLEVMPLAYDGTDSRGKGYYDFEMGVNAVLLAIYGGSTIIDTAPKYGAGQSEEMIAEALRCEPANVIVTTKIGCLFDNDGYDFSYDAAMRTFEGSLKRLRVDTLPIVYLHDPMGVERSRVMKGVFRAMQKLKEQGVVKWLGIAANDPETNADYIETGLFDVAVVPDCWSMIDQRAEKRIIPAARKYGMGLVAATVVERGLLATGPVGRGFYLGRNFSPECLEHVKRIRDFCEEGNVPLGAAALQWATRTDVFASAIPGARTPGEVAQNTVWAKMQIPDEFWAEFDKRELARQIL